jgi:hypothetical protein
MLRDSVREGFHYALIGINRSSFRYGTLQQILLTAGLLVNYFTLKRIPEAYLLQAFSTVLISAVYLRFFHPLSRFPGPALAPYSNVMLPISWQMLPILTWKQAWWYYTILNGRGPWDNHRWHQKWGV